MGRDIYYKAEANIGVPTWGYGIEISETKNSGDHPAFKQQNKTVMTGFLETSTTSNYGKTKTEEVGKVGVSTSVNVFLFGVGAEFKIEWKDVPVTESEIEKKC